MPTLPASPITISRAALGYTLTCALVVSRVGAQEAELRPHPTLASGFGGTVALSQGRLLVAAPGDDRVAPSAGAVYVFANIGGTWEVTESVAPPPGGGSSSFGRRIAADGETLIIGEPLRSDTLTSAGAVHVFERGLSGSYRHTQRLAPVTPSISGGFGSALAIDDDLALIGEPGGDGNALHTGAAFVYARRGDAWHRAATLSAPDGESDDAFGFSLLADGPLAFVGAPQHGPGGAVYVFSLRDDPAGRWELIDKLVPPTGEDGIEFGHHIATDGQWLLIGAPAAIVTTEHGGLARAGAAYLFERSRTIPRKWRQVARIEPLSGRDRDRFGHSVAVGNDVIAIGAPESDAMGEDTGSVDLLSLGAGAELSHLVRLAVPAAFGGSRYGSSVAIQSDLVVVGAPGAWAAAGATYVHDLSRLASSERVSFELLANSHTGLATSTVSALAQDADGYLLIGTQPTGLAVHDGYSFKHHRHDPGDPDSIANDRVLSLLADDRGRIWVGTEDGLDRFDRRTGRFTHYRLGSTGRATQPIAAIHQDRQGGIWTGTNGRLYEYDAARDRFTEFGPFTGLPDELGEPYVSGIQEDAEGALWVLSKNLWQNHASLYRVDVLSRQVHRYPMAADWGQLGPFLIDSRGEFWFKAPAPADFSPERDGTVRPSLAPVDQIHWNISEDSQDVVWIATSDGLHRKRPEETAATFHRLAPAAGERILNWTQAVYEDPSGNLLIGTRSGIYRRVGRPATALPYLPRISLTRVRVAGSEGTRDLDPDDAESIQLGHLDYSLAFAFAAPNYIDPGEVAYRYRLEPLDRGWTQADDSRSATYTSLAPGEYTFRVQGQHVVESLSPTGVALRVTVHPAYWQTWWFRLLVGIAITAAVAAAMRYRADRGRDLLRMRRRIAGDLHDDLSTNLSGIALMSQRVRRGDVLGQREITYLDTITDTSRSMLEDLRDLVWMIDPGHDEVRHLVDKMHSVAQTLLPDRCTFAGDELSSMGQLGMVERREVLRIYKELLHNIVRHADANRVSVQVRGHDRQFVLRVRDNGIGFDPAAVTNGYGLKSVRRRAERLGGTLRIDSQPGEGTLATFAMDLP